jgi:hypothetical protein
MGCSKLELGGHHIVNVPQFIPPNADSRSIKRSRVSADASAELAETNRTGLDQSIMNRAMLAPLRRSRVEWLRGPISIVTRRGLIQLLATAAAAKNVWPYAVGESKEKEPFLEESWISVEPRSMFFSLQCPTIRILCAVGRTTAGGRIRAVRVNDELIPCSSKSTVAGSYFHYDTAGLVIHVEERVVRFNLSRFPEIHALIAENAQP